MIPHKKISEGILLCQENVDRLAADAFILGEFGSHGHALASIILAIEEYAKKIILYNYKLSPTAKNEAEVEKALYKHEIKLDWYVSKAVKTFDTKKLMEEQGLDSEKLRKKVSDYKFSGLYTNWNKEEVSWSKPNRPEIKGQYKFFAKSLAYLMLDNESMIPEPYRQKNVDRVLKLINRG